VNDDLKGGFKMSAAWVENGIIKKDDGNQILVSSKCPACGFSDSTIINCSCPPHTYKKSVGGFICRKCRKSFETIVGRG